MAKRTGPSNPQLQALILELRKIGSKQKVSLWKRIADELERPTRSRREVNIENINRSSKPNELVIIPGKVLGNGELDHKVTVSAWKFSQQAFTKINKQGKALSIQQLLKENPKPSTVRILG